MLYGSPFASPLLLSSVVLLCAGGIRLLECVRSSLCQLFTLPTSLPSLACCQASPPPPPPPHPTPPPPPQKHWKKKKETERPYCKSSAIYLVTGMFSVCCKWFVLISLMPSKNLCSGEKKNGDESPARVWISKITLMLTAECTSIFPRIREHCDVSFDDTRSTNLWSSPMHYVGAIARFSASALSPPQKPHNTWIRNPGINFLLVKFYLCLPSVCTHRGRECKSCRGKGMRL